MKFWPCDRSSSLWENFLSTTTTTLLFCCVRASRCASKRAKKPASFWLVVFSGFPTENWPSFSSFDDQQQLNPSEFSAVAMRRTPLRSTGFSRSTISVVVPSPSHGVRSFVRRRQLSLTSQSSRRRTTRIT